MKDKINKLFLNQKWVKGVLVASIGINLTLIGWVLFQQFRSDASTNHESKPSHQELLTSWKPFGGKDEPIQESPTSSSTDSNDSDVLAEEQPPASKEETSSTPESELELPIEEPSDSNVEAPSTDLKVDEDLSDASESSEVSGFSIHPISSTLQATLDELAKPDPSVITYDDLRLVKVLYWGFDNQTHMGELIVHQAVAEEVMEIFEEVYAVHYPIEKIRLISEYQNSDEDSMRDNNTSSFNYREVTNGSELSLHAYGLAIDINPKMNPYVSEDYVLPANAMAYVDREQSIPGMIQEGDALHQAFTSRGWEWGGDWTRLKDYQHFSKSID